MRVWNEPTSSVRYHQIILKESGKKNACYYYQQYESDLTHVQENISPFMKNKSFWRHATLLDFSEIDSAQIMSLRLSQKDVPHHLNLLRHRPIYFCIDVAGWRRILCRHTEIRFSSSVIFINLWSRDITAKIIPSIFWRGAVSVFLTGFHL